jgi:uncharacterized membrane protein YphA (DoxX/SURF4 family)
LVADLGLGAISSAVSVSAALLLIPAAIAKLRAPAATVALLRRLHLPAPRLAGPMIAGAELVSALLALTGGAGRIPMAALYLAFALVAVRVLISSPGASCGCFGATETPVTALHVIVTAGFAAASAAGPWTPSARTLLRGHPFEQTVLIAQIGVLSALAYAALAVYPQLVAAQRKVSS